MKRTGFAMLAALLPALVGCLQDKTAVKLKPDGSGTIERTSLISDAMVEMMAGFAQLAAGQNAGDTKPGATPELFTEEKAKQGAAKMGEGVTFVSFEKVAADGFQGMKAVYAFTDITKVKLDLKPDAPGPMAGAQRPAGGSSEPMEIRFQKGDTSVLTLVLPKPKSNEAAAAPKEEKDAKAEMPSDEEMAQMKEMFKGMKFSLTVEVPALVKTNSPWVDGSTVTLFEIDFEALLSDPARLKKMTDAQPKSLAEAQEWLKDVKGIKFPTEPEITIEFK